MTGGDISFNWKKTRIGFSSLYQHKPRQLQKQLPLFCVAFTWIFTFPPVVHLYPRRPHYGGCRGPQSHIPAAGTGYRGNRSLWRPAGSDVSQKCSGFHNILSRHWNLLLPERKMIIAEVCIYTYIHILKVLCFLLFLQLCTCTSGRWLSRSRKGAKA